MTQESHGLVPCWECREDGEPWTFDCDQCNPDGMFRADGTVDPNYR